MKKGFLYILSFASIVCLSSGMYAAEESGYFEFGAAEEFDEDSQKKLEESKWKSAERQLVVCNATHRGSIFDRAGKEEIWTGKEVKNIFAKLGGEAAEVQYRGNDRIKEIISLKNGKLLWKGKKISWMNYSSLNKMIEVRYSDDNSYFITYGEIIDTESWKVILRFKKDKDVEWVDFNPNLTRVTIGFKNGEVVKINLPYRNGKLIFEDGKVYRIGSNSKWEQELDKFQKFNK